jgi:hypothetical protein
VFALFLSACAGQQLKAHALAAVASGAILDEVGQAIEVEAAEDYAAAGGVHANDDELAVMHSVFAPIRADCGQVRAAHADYERAVSSGDLAAARASARALFSLWSRLDAIADQLGLDVPPVPDALRRLAGGDT